MSNEDGPEKVAMCSENQAVLAIDIAIYAETTTRTGAVPGLRSPQHPVSQILGQPRFQFDLLSLLPTQAAAPQQVTEVENRGLNGRVGMLA